MRVDPECVYLRLEPGAHIINHRTGDVRSAPAVELHWKDGNRWKHRTFVGNASAPTLGAILGTMGEWLDTFSDLDAMLSKAGGA